MIRASVLTVVGASLLLGCPGTPGDLVDAGAEDASVEFDGGDGGDGGDGAWATALFNPTPPVYWYVDSSVLSLGVTGAGVIAYRVGLDDATLGAETPVAAPINLSSISAGHHTLKLIGKNAAGEWQPVPTVAPFHMASASSEPTSCVLKTAGGPCDLIVQPGAARYYATAAVAYDQNMDGRPDFETVYEPAPGARICLATGTFAQVSFRGFAGTEAQPLTFINCGGPANIVSHTSGSGLSFEQAHFFRVVGIGSVGDPYGISITTDLQNANGLELAIGSSDYEVAYLEIKKADYAGIVARSNLSCTANRSNFVQRNTFLHHNYVHDTKGEGFYIGASHWNFPDEVARGEKTCADGVNISAMMCSGVCVFESELHGVRVYANRTAHTGAEGIQLSSAFGDVDLTDGRIDWDTEVYDNSVNGADEAVGAFNSGGLSLQAGTTGRFFRNRVENVGSNGYAAMFIMGPGHVSAFNNVLLGPAPVGIAIQDNNAGARNGPFFINNNTIVLDGGTEGIYLFHWHSTGNEAHDNLILGATNPVRKNDANVQLTQSNNLSTGAPSLHFVNAPLGDFHLKTTSPAVDTGIDTSTWGVLSDFDTHPRIGPYDVGAYEAN